MAGILGRTSPLAFLGGPDAEKHFEDLKKKKKSRVKRRMAKLSRRANRRVKKHPNQSIIDQLDEAGRIIYEGRICPKAGEKIKTQAAIRKEIRVRFPFGHEMTAQAISKRESILRKLDSGPIPDREMKEAGFVLCNNIKVKVSKDLTVREFKKILVPSGEKKQGKDVLVALASPSTRVVSFGIHSVVDVVLKDGDLVEPGTRYYTLGVCNLKEGK